MHYHQFEVGEAKVLKYIPGVKLSKYTFLHLEMGTDRQSQKFAFHAMSDWDSDLILSAL